MIDQGEFLKPCT